CVSDDGGKTWRKSSTGMDQTGATHILLDPNSPTNARVLYVAGFGRGVYKSSDGGKSWTLKNQGITQKQPFAWRLSQASDGTVYDVTFDPNDSNVVYASGFESSAWRSSDRGEHWSRIPGFNFKWGYRVIPDPVDRNKVYVSTFGGSLWHGSLLGHDEPLDIATPKLQPGTTEQ